MKHIRPTAIVLLFAMLSTTSTAGERTISVVMNYGGQLRGRLLSQSNDVLVLEIDGLPCAVAYDQLESKSAYKTMRDLMIARRGSADALSAEDHYRLGVLLLGRNRPMRAKRALRVAARMDASYQEKSDDAIRRFRSERKGAPIRQEEPRPPVERDGSANNGVRSFAGSGYTDAQRAKIIEGYKRVGDDVAKQVGADTVLVETQHFLIWTDWAKAEHGNLATWCESMYAELSRMFNIPADKHVFPGKSLIFCLRSQSRFVKAANILDNYNAVNALGYTSTDANGHSHVVVFRQGGSPTGRDAFASTLVHEGVHAFIHAYRGQGRIPTWLNEGLANVVAEQVLGDRCPNAETAVAAGEAFVRANLPLSDILIRDGMLDARLYPLAHSVVACLMAKDHAGFSEFINDIKSGVSMEDALNRRYGLSVPMLEKHWRAWVLGGSRQGRSSS